MVLRFYGETGRRTTEYNFSNGQVIFVFDKYEGYSKPMTEGKIDIVIVKENRYYFADRKIIRWLEDKKLKDEKLFTVKAKEILNDIKEFF